MPQFVAFLRAINVGGHNVKMDTLRGLFEDRGLQDVETFIASGNVIFTSRSKSENALQRKIEAHLHESLGYEVATFIRTPAQVAAVARYRPFTQSRLRTAKALGVAFLAKPLATGAKKPLMALRTEIDDFHVHGREVYWLCRKRQSESKFSNVLFEKALGVRSTFRGVNTIVRLATKYGWTHPRAKI